ncbi:HD domain-containing protein [Halobacteria archaeon HArc-gm2]|nr:HD domain-containing protein [Halobacteria archaeon HArc-gm2]
MITIKDAIQGHIDVEGIAEELIDTPVVQRLRGIQQLGNTSLVYPSANHTRFEHSLGVYYLADQALEKLDIGAHEGECIRAAAILHDIGHGPFSHNTEPILESYLGKTHEEVEDLLEEGPVNDILSDFDIDPGYIADLVSGKGKYGQLISGELDVDRMDYLARDAHHAGVPYGNIDHDHLIHTLTFAQKKLSIKEGNKEVAENLLTARALMNPTVYNHPTARICEAMLLRATEMLLETNQLSAQKLRRMDDHDLTVKLRKEPATQSLINRLDNRDLFKQAVWVGIHSVPEQVLDASREEERSYEDLIAENAGLDSTNVIVDIPDRPSIPESETHVIENGHPRPLRDASSIIRALESTNRNQWRLGIYCPEEHVQDVRESTSTVLDVQTTNGFVNNRTGDHRPQK